VIAGRLLRLCSPSLLHSCSNISPMGTEYTCDNITVLDFFGGSCYLYWQLLG
jgi:hypothetical protein